MTSKDAGIITGGARTKLLDRIYGPEDVRKLNLQELTLLAEEIRHLIIETVSRTGGHLASSLGTVELALALHYIFDTPRDKIIWDVGHQAYAHKIITGRKDVFHTLRQKGGISGFPKREESLYDVFGTGHSSTSISAASGIAEARCLTNTNYKVVAVIGDGSLSAGLAYEGINWAGARGKDLVVVLNDNEMSISRSVGALTEYLSRVMTGQHMTKFRASVQHFMKTIPGIGEQMVKFTKQVEESLKGFIVPGILFEEMGFMYVGPLQGHHLDHLIKTFQNIRGLDRPVLVHVLTKKGKGYAPAEEKPSQFHGIGPYDIVTGSPIPDDDMRPTYTEVFGKTIVDIARQNPNVVAITAAMTYGTGLQDFAREFPQRFYDVGIAEQHGVTFAAGLAAEGLIPVVAIYSTFLQRAYDQVIHDVCLQKLPVVFAIDRGGIVGDDGPTHHGLFDFAFLRSIPNLVVMAPKDENELRHMLKTAIECGRPASIRYPRGKGIGCPLDGEPKTLEVGKAEVLREGADMLIAAIGSTVPAALAAAELLSSEGINATVVNSRFVKPLDAELFARIASTVKRVLTVEEGMLAGGFGSGLLELFEERGIAGISLKRLGIADRFVEHATQAELRRIFGIDAEGIASAARALMLR